MPVHVDHRDGERQALLVEPVEQRQVRLVRVRVVPAPPVPERPPGHQRRRSGHRVERPERGRVVATEREDADVASTRDPAADPPVVLEQERLAVVERDDAVTGEHPGLERHPSVDVVERTAGPAEVARLLAVPPPVRVRPGGLDDESGGRERTAVVPQGRAVGRHLDAGSAPDDRVLRHVEAAADREGGGAVLEPAVLAPLDPEQAVLQDGDAPAVADDDGVRVRHGVGAGEGADGGQGAGVRCGHAGGPVSAVPAGVGLEARLSS